MPEHAQLPMFQSHVPKHQKRHAWQYDYHHRRPSCQVRSTLVQDQLYEQFLGEYRILDSNGPQILAHFYQVLQPEYGFPRYRSHPLYQQLLERCDLEQQLFYSVLSPFGQTFANLQKPAGWLLREQDGDQCIIGKFHHLPHEPRVHPRFYHKVFSEWSFYSPVRCKFKLVGFQSVFLIVTRRRLANLKKAPRQSSVVINIKK